MPPPQDVQFSGKYGKIICWRPPGELASSPQGNPGSATGYDSFTCVFRNLKLLNNPCD